MQLRFSFVATVLTFVGTIVLINAQDGRQHPPPSPPPSAPIIDVKDGLLTAKARNHPLGAVLAELGSRTKVALVAAPEIEQDPVSAHVEALPLDRGLRELLKNYDTFFYYGGQGEASTELRIVWIYPKGAAAMLQPVPPEAWASSRELKALLAASNPTVREQTYEALMSRPDPESQELVIQAIRGATEFDPELRQRILSSAISKGVVFPPDLLPYMAVADASEEIRSMALDALVTHTDVKRLAEAALSDPSEAVRDRAAQILADLSAGARRQR
ncbi:MAG TPA: hypothetical protein VHJ58_10890 [Vicinamibacterales bacterium]|nr:hypothetical protein [Vicinamibacterales bacterium]